MCDLWGIRIPILLTAHPIHLCNSHPIMFELRYHEFPSPVLIAEYPKNYKMAFVCNRDELQQMCR